MAAAIASESGDLWPRDATGVSLIAGSGRVIQRWMLAARELPHSGTSGIAATVTRQDVNYAKRSRTVKRLRLL
jgi:hypothetical protein